ncbi:MAG: NAD(P)/FAD-dependent oxidoreductase [Gammaproteobacteria bacterium]
MSTLALPDSLWAATATPAPHAPPYSGERKADAVVVGGGYTGLSAALHLAEAGADAVVLEAAEPGWGASGRNGGQVVPGLRTEIDELTRRFGAQRAERMFEFSGAFADFTFDLIERHGIDCQATRCGWIHAAHAAAGMKRLEKRAAFWAARGAPVEILERSKTEAFLGTGWYPGAYLDKRGGAVQPLSYARGLAKAAQQAGAAVHGRSRVTALERKTGGWRVQTSAGAIDAGQVLLCTNAYARLDGAGQPWPGLAQSIIAAYSFQIATRPLTDNMRATILPEGHTAADTRRLTTYFRLDHEGRLLMGGRGGLDGSTEPASFDPVVSRLKELFPQAGSAELEYFWNGRVALTLDHVPHLHELAPGLFAALGYNGRGVAMTGMIGKLLADWSLGANPNDIPLPVTRLRSIPFHRLRLPAMRLAVRWKGLCDQMEHRKG